MRQAGSIPGDMLLGDVEVGARRLKFVDPRAIEAVGLGRPSALPYCLRVVLENMARNREALGVSDEELARVGKWTPDAEAFSAPVLVSRVILPDSSGVPVLIDLAALRSALAREGRAPEAVEPRIPVDLVVDHSLIVEEAGHTGAAARNVEIEFERNAERYALLKWAQNAFAKLRVVPPGMGIVHQVHIERLARVIDVAAMPAGEIAFPEFVLGGDSHTPMVGALGVMGWGVGGIEAEAAMLGQPYLVRIDRVVGVRLTGALRPGATATDLVLLLTQRLREVGVVGQFVEFFGDGAEALSVPDRATLANMAPEYGATTGFFPIDAHTIVYLRQTGREPAHVQLVETVARAGGLFREPGAMQPNYSHIVEIDIDEASPCVAGPRRPQERTAIADVKNAFEVLLSRAQGEGGFGVAPDRVNTSYAVGDAQLHHGALAIAAITSCTNTSNPSVMLGAGLIAKNAVARGISPKPWVKSSLAPGSRVVTRYLERAGLLDALEQLGFYVVGYGCTTCSGKSGPLVPGMTRAIEEEGLLAASILSGNRNFEGRIHRLVRANYIGSPMLVVAYALAGRIDIDLEREPLAQDSEGNDVFLADLWPSGADMAAALGVASDAALFADNYARLFEGEEHWRALAARSGALFDWREGSTYVVEPPFFSVRNTAPTRLLDARVLALFGDALTTDHISPAGEIPRDSAAGAYLSALGVAPKQFNAFTQRRGNHEVMARGAFAHPRIRNLLTPEVEGGFTRTPEGETAPIYDVAARYRREETPMIIIAGRDYGMGSSRDWAAKGTALLGVQAVIAESFERIHRSNLIALGVAPLLFSQGEGWRALGLTGAERFTLRGLDEMRAHGASVWATATSADGRIIRFEAKPALDSQSERACLAAGGMFATIKDALMAQQGSLS